MKNMFMLVILMCALLGVVRPSSVYAQVIVPEPALFNDATASASPTPDVEQATPAATLRQQPDITQPTQGKSPLVLHLESVAAQPLNPTNFVQHAIRDAVSKGVPANILVLLLLFPVTASLIAFFRHVIGLRGFGIYTPAVLAVAFISTGIVRGLVLFGAVFVATVIGKNILAKMKLQYLPRTALLLWLVSLVVFSALILSAYTPASTIFSVSIFPLLVIILLSENFSEAQVFGNLKKATQLTIETLFLAIIAAVFMRTLDVQKFVIVHPEITILAVLLIDIAVGRYTGLRISEYFRFGPLLDPEE